MSYYISAKPIQKWVGSGAPTYTVSETLHMLREDSINSLYYSELHDGVVAVTDSCSYLLDNRRCSFGDSIDYLKEKALEAAELEAEANLP